MLKMLFNKKGKENVMLSNIIFIVVNVLFLSMLMLGVSRMVDTSKVIEQSYAKQVGLMMNAAEGGTNIEIDASDLIDSAIKNNVRAGVTIDCEQNVVLVRASRSGTYRYRFYNELKKCSSSLDLDTRKLKIEVGDE